MDISVGTSRASSELTWAQEKMEEWAINNIRSALTKGTLVSPISEQQQ